jgi:AmmeMemoRadiSam system protein B
LTRRMASASFCQVHVLPMNPRLRSDLSIFPAPRSSGGGLILVDPLGLSGEEPLHVSADAAPLLPLLDGAHSAADLQLAATRLRGGILVTQSAIQQFLERLSQRLMLQNESYEQRSQELRDEWDQLTERPPSQAGTGYPADPQEVSTMLEAVMEGSSSSPGAPPWILVAPHADIGAARLAYQAVYSHCPSGPPARVILVGTGHHLSDALFSIANKDYLTPLGRSPCDTEAVVLLRKSGGAQIASDDWDHRAEHSLEFQCLFLHYLWGENQPPVVPILCGSLERYLSRQDPPHRVPDLRAFLQHLAAIATSRGTLTVAGIDLSHLGPKFGHSAPADSLLPAAKQHDESLLRHLFEGNPDGVWEEALRTRDRFNVCGLSTILWLAYLAQDCRGELLRHDVWRQQQLASAVTMAAAVLYRA